MPLAAWVSFDQDLVVTGPYFDWRYLCAYAQFQQPAGLGAHACVELQLLTLTRRSTLPGLSDGLPLLTGFHGTGEAGLKVIRDHGQSSVDQPGIPQQPRDPAQKVG